MNLLNFKLRILPLLFLAAFQTLVAQQPTDAEITTAASTITLGETNREKPVVMGAALVKSEVSNSEKAYAVVKIKIEDNWHIYAYVPEGGYFIMSELQLSSDNDHFSSNLIKEPKIHGYEADPNIMIYKGELIFVYEVDTKNMQAGEHALNAVLNYQPCDPYICLPPSEIKKSLQLTIK